MWEDCVNDFFLFLLQKFIHKTVLVSGLNSEEWWFKKGSEFNFKLFMPLFVLLSCKCTQWVTYLSYRVS